MKDVKLSNIAVVTGRDADKVEASLDLRSQDRLVHNANFEQGMTSSIQSGLTALKDSDAVMIALGDMPWLKAEDYNQLVDYFYEHGGQDKILVPWYGEQRGNPVIFGRTFFDVILNHKEPNGCSQVVRQNRGHVVNLNITNQRFIMDIDTLDDLDRGESHA